MYFSIKNIYLFTLITTTLLTLIGGCATTSTYHRAGLTPIPQPSIAGGGNFRGRHQLSLGSTVASTVNAHEGVNPAETNPDGDSISFSDGEANWIPRTEASLIYKRKYGQFFTMGVLGEMALNTGAIKSYEDTLNLRPKGNAYGLGVTMQLLLPIHHNLHLGVGMDLMLFSVPYVKMATNSTDHYSVDLWEPKYGTEMVGVYSFYFIPNYKLPWGAIYGGLTIRNHPTTPAVQTETSVTGMEDVEEGKPYYVLSMGAQINISYNLALQIMIFQPITTSPVVYYPMGAIGLTWDIDAINPLLENQSI
jgi:hypothetical protein